jgi:hypothetical protein
MLHRRALAKGESNLPDASSDEPGGLLWIRQGDFVRPAEVRVGLSDGLFTEIAAAGLSEGTDVVVAANRIESQPDALSILPHTWSEPAKTEPGRGE